MSEPPLVSVVLATTRHSPYLADALASVAAQTHPAWELIIVDDGSPQPEAIDTLAAGVPGTTVIHQANAGVSVARNVGIARSRGRYLAFIDDDDAWVPERLALQVAALTERPDAVASYGQIDFLDEDGTVFGTGTVGPGDFGAFLRTDTGVPIVTLMVVRRALDRVGVFHPMFALGEDLDLTYRLARTGPFVFVPDVLVHYRRHGANMTGDSREAALWSRRALWLQQWWSTRAGETGVLDDVRIGLRTAGRYWTDRIIQEAVHQARIGHPSVAAHYLAFVARYDPVAGLRSFGALAQRKLRPPVRPGG